VGGSIPTFSHELASSGSQSDESKILSESEFTSPFSYEAGSSSAGNAPDVPTESKLSSEVSENDNLNVVDDEKFPSELDRTPTLPHDRKVLDTKKHNMPVLLVNRQRVSYSFRL
jgi:hypothetical protein